MYTREKQEKWEQEYLSPSAVLSSEIDKRPVAEEPCPIRTEFQRDRDRIIHSKSFRRLKHKTQVFIAPEGDHYRTRLTHTLEVSQISRTIARALCLNEDLTEAIALGHDLGHTPFGHAGEEALDELLENGFEHNKQSLRVVTLLENSFRDFKGLNLTREVCDGILKHTGPLIPETLEGQVVRIADRIAYINHDIDDALRAGLITLPDLPKEAIAILGEGYSERINTMVLDLIEHSLRGLRIKMGPEIGTATNQLRDYLFEKIYVGSLAKKEEEKAKNILKKLYYYYLKDPELLKEEFNLPCYQDFETEELVVDYIAGMTDRYALSKARELLLPRPWLG